MITFKNNIISLSRGDSATIELAVELPSGTIYDLKEGDKVEFFLRKEPSKLPTNQIILKKTFNNRKIIFNPSDTLYLEGGTYYYDITFTSVSGYKETVKFGKFFILM